MDLRYDLRAYTPMLPVGEFTSISGREMQGTQSLSGSSYFEHAGDSESEIGLVSDRGHKLLITLPKQNDGNPVKAKVFMTTPGQMSPTILDTQVEYGDGLPHVDVKFDVAPSGLQVEIGPETHIFGGNWTSEKLYPWVKSTSVGHGSIAWAELFVALHSVAGQ